MTLKTVAQRDAIIEYLTDNPAGTVVEFESVIGVKSSRVKEIIYGLVDDDIVEAVGEDKKRTYRLKR